MGSFGRRMDTSRLDKEFNALGAQGWELVNSKSSTPAWGNETGIVCIFKRKIVTASSR